LSDAEEAVLEQDPKEISLPSERAKVVFTQWHYDPEAGVGLLGAEDYATRLIDRLREEGLFLHLRETVLPPSPLDLAYWTLESPPQFEEHMYLNDLHSYLANNNPWEPTEDGPF